MDKELFLWSMCTVQIVYFELGCIKIIWDHLTASHNFEEMHQNDLF